MTKKIETPKKPTPKRDDETQDDVFVVEPVEEPQEDTDDPNVFTGKDVPTEPDKFRDRKS